MESGKMQHRISYVKITPAPCARTRHYHNVQTTIEHAARDPVCFTDESGNSVSDNAVPDLLADRDPQSVVFKVVRKNVHDQNAIGKASAVFINVVKLRIIL